MRFLLFSLCACVLVVLAGDLHAQLPEPSSAKPLFQDRPFGPRPSPTPTPARKRADSEEQKPIPAGWIIGGAAALALATVGLLYGSQRAWRSSNLFDRQYLFPVEEKVEARFGAKKCGGHLASVRFGRSSDTPVAGEPK